MIWIWMLPLMGVALAVEVVDGPHVEVSEKGAVVRWKTSGESGSRVRFGVSKDQLQTQTAAGGGVTTHHEVKLEGLKPATVYYFNVGTARRVLKEGQFATLGAGAPSQPMIENDAPPRGPPGPAIEESKPKPTQSPALKVPPLRAIWGSLDSLEDHYERHGPDFQSRSAEEYAQQAWLFLQRAIDEGFPAKLDDADGTVRVFDPKTRAFAAYRRDGKARTYFKPGSRDYFERQPGKPVRLTRRASR
ncbi:fibronectin type III domain-containing protein [Phragmitibacter flavus]|nr:fibronectin type III domain-containing protein [Phragmitibacter flavus]